ncbi:hypothetical protein ACFQL1_24600 [Halomicroarcula sp. GCM10025709]|uniref:DUF7260 family protein n=1 Tax=Haloarcula TaxID=2237 RepID=UPI0024C2D1BC|nr:hypothetical protein [Halomicroarcula sp. YJ-61-S]
MVQTTLPGGPRQYLRIFRHHVVEPISDAQSRVSREREEVAAERSAFESFRTAVSDLRPATATPSNRQRSVVSGDDCLNQVERLADAFESTVMSVPHYEAVYGESLSEHMLAELGDFTAAVVDSSTSTVTPHQRSALLTAVDCAIDDRTAYADVLDEEATALATAGSAIKEIVESLDDVIIQDWYKEEFEVRLDEIVRDRQSVIHSRISPSPVDGRSLCMHLYADQPWTFPVLTAVTRLHDAVVVE